MKNENKNLKIQKFQDSHSDSVNSLAFFRDGRHLLSGGSDGLVNLFDVSMPKEDDALKSTNQVGFWTSYLCHFVKISYIPYQITLYFKRARRASYYVPYQMKS